MLFKGSSPEKVHSKIYYTLVRKLWACEVEDCEEQFQGEIDNNGDRKALCHISPLCFSHHSVCPPKYWPSSWEEDAPLVMVKDIKAKNESQKLHISNFATVL